MVYVYYYIILFLKQAISAKHLHRMGICLETTLVLSGVLAFDHEQDKKTKQKNTKGKKNIPVSATLSLLIIM